MITICQYLEVVFQEFKSYLQTNPQLCIHKQMNYHLKETPDYNNIHLQEHYILRYTYAYAYEYKSMFRKCLPSHQQFFIDPTIRVLSIGCGNAVDYWSLVQVAEEKRLTSRIEYTGVDKVIWTYSFQERTKDKLVVKHDEICDYLTEIAAINYNYIIFPKSICEFSDEDFARILSFFRSVKIENPRICILTSFRATPNSCALDQNRFFRVIDSIRKNRNDEFKSIGKEYTIYKGDEEKIEKRDTSFKYPHIAQITLGTLHEYCGGFINKGVTCMDCKPLLDRYPLKCTKDVYYGIALLEKGSKD